MNLYYCEKCNLISPRESKLNKIKSICDITGGNVFLTRVKNIDDLSVKLRKVYLKNEFDLESFKPKDRRFLEIAFEQGCKVALNSLKV